MMFSKRKTIREVFADELPGGKRIEQNQLMEYFSAKSNAAPWYVHMFMIIGSWIGVFLIAIFIGFQVKGSSGGVFATFGVVFTIAAILLYRSNPNSNFVQHLSIPISLLGLICLTIGIALLSKWSARGTAGVVALVELAIFLVYTDAVRRFICMLTIPVALAFVFYSKVSLYPYQLVFLILIILVVMLWENQERILKLGNSSFLMPALFGSVTSLLVLLLATVYRDKSMFRTVLDYNQWWVTTLFITIAFLYVIRNALHRLNQPNQSYAIFGGALVVLIALLTYHSPGVLASLMVLIIAYSHGSRILFSVAAVFLIVFMSAYYYNLGISLLYKSFSLMASGVVVLLAAWVMHRLPKSDEQ